MELTDLFGWVGATIDAKFVVEAVAGEGAFAVVYRGRHLALDEPIALKCLKIPAQISERDRASLLGSFRAEARTLHRLSRRTASIVQALDLGAAVAPSGAWTPYIVMEWLDGETLQQDLDRRRAEGAAPRTIDEAIELISPAAFALSIAHGEGVVHRDLKPSNIFLAATRQETMTKVLDFGIAKFLVETHSRTGAFVETGKAVHAFTPQYAAPEQYSVEFGTAGPWTDVFAMGLILVELASGSPALEGSDLMQLYVACVDERRRPSLSRRGIPVRPAVDQVLRRALEVRPERRFASMGEMWRALQAANAAHAITVQGSEPATTPDPGFSATLLADSPAHAGPSTLASGAPARAATGTDSPRAWSSGENRICTVLFASVTGFDALAGQLEPDQMKEILDHCFAVLTERIEAMGGRVDRVLGESVTAVFGVPRATDNDAERCVHAALQMQGALAGISLPGRALRTWRPTARIGIGTGRVFAGPATGTAGRDFTVIGEAVNVAARLQQVAPPGSVVIGAGTQRQVAGLFEVEPLVGADGRLETRQPRGGPLIETVTAFRVLRASDRKPLAGSTAFYGLSTEFVGRSGEMVRIVDRLETVRSDSRATLLTLVGPPGVGRSRMLSELAATLSRDGHYAVMAAQSSPLSAETSYALMAALIRSAFHVQDDDALEDVKRKLLRGIRELHGGTDGSSALGFEPQELDAVALSISTILGADPTRPPESDEVWSSKSREHGVVSEGGAGTKQRLSTAVARLVTAIASRRPVAILCDDLQWADDASLDLLDDLVVRSSELPVFVFAAARPLLYERRPHWGEGKAGHVRMEVEPLARRHVEQIARDRLRRVDGLSTEFVRLLGERAEGSPLILDEMLHLLVDAGAVDPSDGERWVVREERLGALELPPTIQGIVQARLDRLELEARTALAQAAVVGRTFWRGAVEALRAADPEPGSAPLDKVLADLRDRNLIRVREASTLAGEQELVFAESATQEVAYGTLSVRVRRPFHRAAARWLEARAKSDAHSALIALHHDRGGDGAAAAVHYARAGIHAAALGQNAQALRHFERAREIHDEALHDAGGSGSAESTVSLLEDSADARVATWRDRTRLRLDLGDVLRCMGRLDDAERAYGEARTRLLRAESRRQERWQETEPLLWEARIDFRLALTHKVRGEAAEARELVERAIARATEAGGLEETPAMWALLAGIHRREGDLPRVRTACLKGLRVSRDVLQKDARTREAVSALLMTLGGYFYSTGKLVQAERFYRQAARAVDEATQPQAASFALSDAGAVRFARGDWVAARDLFVRALKLKERQGDLYQIAIGHCNLAEVELRLGQVERALTHASQGVRLGEQVDARADLPDMLKNLAQASLAAGRLEEALDAGARALALAEAPAGRVYLGDVATTLAEICRSAGADRLSPLRPRVLELARTLEETLASHFQTDALRERATRCRELLAGLE